MKSDGIKINWLYIFLLFIIPAIFGITYSILNYYLINLNLPVTGERLGQFGDYVGGLLNPILTFFSFLALLITIVIQNRQLDVSTRELHSTNKTLIENQKVMSEQLLTQSLQQFDSTFFAMLKELNNLQIELNTLVTQNNTKLERCFKYVMYEDSDNIQDYMEKVLKNREVSRYFMLLYQILRIIDTKVDDNIYIKTDKFSIKKMYSNIVRSSISEELMQLLMINALNNIFQSFKDLIEKFNLFEHTSFTVDSQYSLLLINAAQYYDAQAFDQSFYWKELADCNLFGKYIPHNNIITRIALFKKIYKMLSSDNTLIGPFGEKVFNDMNYFCKLSSNLFGDIGLLLDAETFKAKKLGSFENENFYSFLTINTVESQNQITLLRSDTDEKVIDINFQDNSEITFEVSKMINNI
ncbi:putative phage abortive infection protein [Acinetobacter sp. ULE_I057]|uniref:putative phage abortive infection protein n=1 Tax=Acinetobacter sp. ULE_I057 TaxID=3373070 RepID=UPI003AF5E278